ncbi:Z1 domain-containing protein [Spiroplasma cantharicola]|uniref:Putative endonuclease Z1 domain-containing protein n=1 Tax=Spiroplasma cantharicola TaxID=362837 RepID=A0A0M5KH11_9MOLU|nr:Z1 domain-containing protein [Spiroplasma cantharicola]ALD66601.1 hypothetical protein SCANT_v1c06950 [Spiroplasma cantharicola]
MSKEILIDYNFDFLENKKDSDNILDLFLNFNSALVFGEVQSGKTKSILQVISDVIENRLFDIVILLGGTNTILLEQTEERFEEVKVKDKGLIYLDNKNIKSVDFYSLFEDKCVVLINTMKERQNLELISNKIINASTKDKKILLIDDESDYGSINSNKKNKSTKIYSLISEIFNHSKLNKLLMYTATPYANIVNSISEDTKPKVIFPLVSNNDYMGINIFNSMKHYEEIEYIRKEINENVLSKNFIKAIKRFLISNAVYNTNNENKINFELLLNISEITDNHNEIKINVKNCLMDIKRMMNFNTWKNYFQDDLDYLISKGIKINDEDLIFNYLNKILKELNRESNIIILNKKSNEYKSNGFSNKIIIGGSLISRGFTFKYLLVQIMSNSPENKISADTHAQRARWFGYRKMYINYMTIFLPKKDIEAYKEIEELNKTILDYKNKDGVILITSSLIEEVKNKKFDYINITSGGKKC